MNDLKALWERRELLMNLAGRDVKIRYKGSVLGYAWAFFSPLVSMLVYVVVFSVVMRFKVENYAIFLLIGIMAWGLTVNCLNGSAGALISNKGLISKIKFPREVFPLSVMASRVIDFLIALVIIFGLLVLFRIPFTPVMLFLPLVVALQFVFIVGLVLLNSCLNLFYRDYKYILELVTQVWFFMTPIFYPLEMVQNVFPSWAMRLYMLNPMVPIVTMYRDILMRGQLPQWGPYLATLIGSVIFAVIAYKIFKHYEMLFAEIL